MSTVTAVIPCGPMGFAPLMRCLKSLTKEVCDEIVICRYEAGRLQISHDVPVHEVVVPYTPSIAAALVKAGFERATSEWVLLIYPSEWLPAGHQKERLDGITADSILLPVTVVEDSDAKLPRDQMVETRLLRRSAPFGFDGCQFAATNGALLPQSILSQPPAAFYLETGDIKSAHRLSLPSGGANDSRIERRVQTIARRELSKRKAREALWTLFEHMSGHEELWRLGVILDHLPYTLDNDSSIAEMRKKYAAQMGHLADGAGAWYRGGSFQTPHSLDAAYVALKERALVPRTRWLVSECRKRGFKRILELGSTDGNNLFPLTQAYPDLKFTGVEVSKAAVEHGHALSAATGVKIDLRHAESFEAFVGRCGIEGPFDAVALFEVLEHNSPEEGKRLVEAAVRCARPGGRVFITTPCGSWSCHDENCWKLDVRKDHVNAYTADRMRKLLGDVKDLEIVEVENPLYEEANGWLFVSFAR